MKCTGLCVLFTLFLLTNGVGEVLSTNNDGKYKMLLDDVDVLTFYEGEYTTGRRNQPVPQLECDDDGSAGCANAPQVVQCRNVGSDGNNVQWECRGSLRENERFGTLRVSCEGYDGVEDPYVLKGSCGLKYTLESNDKPRSDSGKKTPKTPNKQSSGDDDNTDALWMVLYFFLGIVAFIVFILILAALIGSLFVHFFLVFFLYGLAVGFVVWLFTVVPPLLLVVTVLLAVAVVHAKHVFSAR